MRKLSEALSAAAPEHAGTVSGRLVRVFSPAAAAHRCNFLNSRLKRYYVRAGALFAAEEQLRWAIRFTLVPRKYRNGYGGGYGHGAAKVLEFPQFTRSAADVTLRQVLKRIGEAQGTAMWVVTLKGAELGGRKPCWRGQAPDELTEPVTSRWHFFFRLAGLAELASGELAVDLLLDGWIATVPVLSANGLSGNGGGAAGRAYEDVRAVS